MPLKRKYADSHWLVFVCQGVIALLFGWFTLFANVTSLNILVAVIGSLLLGLGIMELFNMLRRTHLRETWGLSFAMALFDIVVAFVLLFTLDLNGVYQLAIIAAYTVVSGLLQIIMGVKSVDDRTDKFIWALIGICGCIMGFVILNSERSFTESLSFVKIFGAYMMLFGLANMIYGVHNRDQVKEIAEARRATAKKASATRAKKAATKTTVKSAKKPAKKSAKKSAKTAGKVAKKR